MADAEVVIFGPDDLGAALRARRRMLRITQEALAVDIGVTRQRLGELERGKPGIHLEVALRACKALGLTLRIGALS